MSDSPVVLMSYPYVIGVGPSDKTCQHCGSSDKARGGIHIRAIHENPAEWIADEFPTPDDAQAWIVAHSPHYASYRSADRSVLDAAVSAVGD